MNYIINLLFGHLIETFKTSRPISKVFFDALSLWCLNLVFPFCFILFSPILVQNLSDIPTFIVELLRFWLVEGFRFHLVLYVLCLLIVIEEKLN